MNSITQMFYWLFQKRAVPYWCVFLTDCALFLLSAMLVYATSVGPLRAWSAHWQVLGTCSFYLFFYALGFALFRTYKGVIRYSSFVDLQRAGAAVLCGLILSLFARGSSAFDSFLLPVRARDVIMWSFLTLALMWAERVMVKVLYDATYKMRNAKKIFIYGVREGGVAIAKSVRNQSPAQYVLSGFVTDRPDMGGKMLLGANVYPNDSRLIQRMKDAGVGILFVSPLKSEDLRENDAFVNELIENGIKIYMVPTEQEWDGKSSLSHTSLREIDIEDLLPRKKIEVDMEAIGKQLAGHRILITGAAGSIGSEIVRQAAACHPESMVLIDQAETPLHDIRLMMAREFSEVPCETIVADIAVKRRMEAIFEAHKPEYVFHAAAYKHVPMMEDNPAESVHNNIRGTRVIADLSVRYGVAKFVMVSTDKAVNPTNVMGCSKRVCEIYVQSLDRAQKEGLVEGHTQFVTTRFGNVLGSSGSVIPLFKEQIKRGGPITVTHPDIIRYFMLIPEACKLVLEAGTMGHGGEIFVFDMGEPVRIVDLAKRMIKLSGAQVQIKFTGLRDGEKLYEEVLNERETTLPTPHPKIKVAKVREYDYADVAARIDQMEAGCYTETPMQVVARMKDLVPEFKSQNSVYEQLDREMESVNS